MKTPKKPKLNKPYHVLVYVEDCSMQIKRFKTTKALGAFIDKFLKDNPDYANSSSGNWIDFSITNITGDFHFFTDGLTVK